jgi:hypothetical protein
MSNPMDAALNSLAQSRLIYQSSLVQQKRQPIYTYLGENQGRIVLQTAGGVIEVGQSITNGSISSGSIVPVQVAGGIVRVGGMPRVSQSEQPVLVPKKAGNIKILFTTREGDDFVFWVGGHIRKPIEILRTTSAFLGKISNLGGDRYICDLISTPIFKTISTGGIERTDIVTESGFQANAAGYGSKFGLQAISGGSSGSSIDHSVFSAFTTFSFFGDIKTEYPGSINSVDRIIFLDESRLARLRTSSSNYSSPILPGITKASTYNFYDYSQVYADVSGSANEYSTLAVGRNFDTAIYASYTYRHTVIQSRVLEFSFINEAFLMKRNGESTLLGGEIPPQLTPTYAYLGLPTMADLFGNLIGTKYYSVTSNSFANNDPTDWDVDVYELSENTTKKTIKSKVYAIPANATILSASYSP